MSSCIYIQKGVGNTYCLENETFFSLKKRNENNSFPTSQPRGCLAAQEHQHPEADVPAAAGITGGVKQQMNNTFLKKKVHETGF